jgi:hypothetical protein
LKRTITSGKKYFDGFFVRDERDVDLGGGREERTRSLTPPKQLKDGTPWLNFASAWRE